MYFTIKKAAVWMLLLCVQIAILWVQVSGEFTYPRRSPGEMNISELVDTAKGKVDSWCEYFFCGG